MRRLASIGGTLLALGVAGALAGSSAALSQQPATGVRAAPDGSGRIELSAGGVWTPIGVVDSKTHRFIAGESPELHGADGHCTGGSNDTAAVQAFLDAVRDGGTGTMNGCYRVDEGKLVLMPSPDLDIVTSGGFQSRFGPQLSGNARFVGLGSGRGPLLRIVNPPQKSGNGQFYAGGTLGNIVFNGRGIDTGGDNDGLLIQGLFNWRMGQIVGQSLGGSALALSRKTVNGNPDAYGSANVSIAAVICSACGRPALDIGALTDSGLSVGWAAAYANPALPGQETGVVVSAGQGTTIDHLSANVTRGWALRYGLPGAHGNRQSVSAAELHAPEKGIWIGALMQASIAGRINFAKPPGGDAIWPITPLKIGGQGSVVRAVTVSLIYRLDPPTTRADIVERGLIDLSDDANIDDVTVRLTIIDGANTGLFEHGKLTVPVDRLVRNRNPNARVSVYINGVLATR